MEEREASWKNGLRPVVFLDAVDFKEKPGKVTFFPLHHVFSNSALSHRLLPFISSQINNMQIRNSFVLGIQPESIEEGQKISGPVRAALTEVFKQLIK